MGGRQGPAAIAINLAAESVPTPGYAPGVFIFYSPPHRTCTRCGRASKNVEEILKDQRPISKMHDRKIFRANASHEKNIIF